MKPYSAVADAGKARPAQSPSVVRLRGSSGALGDERERGPGGEARGHVGGERTGTDRGITRGPLARTVC
jgi:hypothetical protein